jgi:hypothetical protein
LISPKDRSFIQTFDKIINPLFFQFFLFRFIKINSDS